MTEKIGLIHEMETKVVGTTIQTTSIVVIIFTIIVFHQEGEGEEVGGFVTKVGCTRNVIITGATLRMTTTGGEEVVVAFVEDKVSTREDLEGGVVEDPGTMMIDTALVVEDVEGGLVWISAHHPRDEE